METCICISSQTCFYSHDRKKSFSKTFEFFYIVKECLRKFGKLFLMPFISQSFINDLFFRFCRRKKKKNNFFEVKRTEHGTKLYQKSFFKYHFKIITKDLMFSNYCKFGLGVFRYFNQSFVQLFICPIDICNNVQYTSLLNRPKCKYFFKIYIFC